ncbi:hypothetical protein HI113_35020 [Corallococcus exiguus]|uniref:hypothetical protein n=1 Tax=Corallococcus exiguus TaxID=83462 RepID=UPI001475900E|nr:hypothetical protein [Corallococcus exiguus]NNB99118.1 hypothetical protein [Corallococcus exiguus]
MLRAVRELAPRDAESRRLLRRALDPLGLMRSLWAEHAGEPEVLPPSEPSLTALAERALPAPLPKPSAALPLESPEAGEILSTRLSQSGGAELPLGLPGLELEVLDPSSAPPMLPPPSPLFVPAWQTGILTAALGVPRPEGPLDVPRMVPQLARRLPVRELPRRQVRSLRLGVQVLVDVSESMVPFAEDRKQLLACVRAVLGPDRVEVRQFAGVPSRGVRRRAGAALHPFEPPASGTPLLVLSDLGIGASVFSDELPDVEEWLHFAGVARRAGCRVVALVPYSSARWPRALRRRMHLLHWDRHTTARAVLQELQR